MNRLLCKIFFHKLIVVKGYNTIRGCRKLYCTRCKRYFGISTSIRAFIPWDFELEDIYILKRLSKTI